MGCLPEIKLTVQPHYIPLAHGRRLRMSEVDDRLQPIRVVEYRSDLGLVWHTAPPEPTILRTPLIFTTTDCPALYFSLILRGPPSYLH
jgi:hypothetical protein